MSKIIGITVGTTTPRPDWNQTDPTKADYIKNKPSSVGGGDGYVLTAGDKQEIANIVIASLPVYNGEVVTV